MPKHRQTCTRCSMRRQRCDRQTPCSRCIQNKEAHLCTTEWVNGYNPSIHRKYPRKSTPPRIEHSAAIPSGPPTALNGSPQTRTDYTPVSSSGQDLSVQFYARENGGTDVRPSVNASYSASPLLSSTTGQPQEPLPSTGNVDFITYGRSPFTDVIISTILTNEEEYSRHKALFNANSIQAREKVLDELSSSMPAGISPVARAVEVFHNQSLLPTKEQVFHMVKYHECNMLYWSGGIYHGPSFRRSLIDAYGQLDELQLGDLDWKWTALLFSILSSSIIGSPEATSTSWGFSNGDKVRLSRKWATATISCLHLGNYASKYHINSVQAILNLHASEHLVGSTKEWAVCQGCSVVIARGLGLHRLAPHPDDGKSDAELSMEQKAALVQREVGRRVWWALSAQDWLCSTSLGMYTIQRKHFNSAQPGYYDEETFNPITDDIQPTFPHVLNYLSERAYLLINYHDEMLDARTIETKYTVVLKYDARMRAVCAEKVPKCLNPRIPFRNGWPRWVAWARLLHQASCSHKLIMIHQSFLGRSFRDPRYAYSRWACTTSAKHIIQQTDREREKDEPQWWVEQAFLVTAGICLSLDLFHRPDKDPEIRENQHLIARTISILESYPNSSVATHGVRLLSSLLTEINKKFEAVQPNHPTQGTGPALKFPDNIVPASLDSAAADVTQNGPLITGAASGLNVWPTNLDAEMNEFDDLMDSLPMEAGLDNNMFLESMLSLANSQFF